MSQPAGVVVAQPTLFVLSTKPPADWISTWSEMPARVATAIIVEPRWSS